MANYLIASDTPVEMRPNEAGAERRFTPTGRGVVSHKDLLTRFREKTYAKHIYSDGFMSTSISEAAYECPRCGFEGVFSRSDCFRCGQNL